MNEDNIRLREQNHPLKQIYLQLSKQHDLDEDGILETAGSYATIISVYLQHGLTVDELIHYFNEVGVPPEQIMIYVYLYMSGKMDKH